mgnify:CR=1 FL=1
MTEDRLILVAVTGGWRIRRETTLSQDPVAVRLDWEVGTVERNPYRFAELEDGAGLTCLGDGMYRTAEGMTLRAPQGGSTQACDRWEADVPPPGGKTPCKWRDGAWWRQLKRYSKEMPVPGDRLAWRKVE